MAWGAGGGALLAGGRGALGLLFAAGFLAGPAARAVEPCSLAGSVVDGRTGGPVANARVTLETSGQRRLPHAVSVSDAQGIFAMAGVSPGVYKLKAARNGYLDSYHGARRPGAAGTTLTLEPGCELMGLTVRLDPFAVIAGTVRDADGEPVIEGRVEISRFAYLESGEKRFETVKSAITDDLGRYRFIGLTPGRYYVRAEPKVWPPPEPDAPATYVGAPEFSIPAFYPGALTAASAAGIDVAAGDRISGMDIALPNSRLFSVLGQVAFPAGTAPDIALAQLLSQQPLRTQASTAVPANGKFVFPGVPPGSYQLRVQTTMGGRMYARLTLVSVSGADVQGVRVTLQPQAYAALEARLVVEGQSRSTLGRVQVSITHADSGSVFTSTITNGGIPNTGMTNTLMPGRSLVQVQIGLELALAGMYLKSIRSGQTDVLAEGLMVPASGTAPLEITLAEGAGKADGNVLNQNGQPAAGVTVLLAPAMASRADLYQTTIADQRGHYAFDRVPPGEYKLYAWDDVEPNIWFDPEFLKRHEGKATPLSVKEKAAASANLRVIETAAQGQ